MSKNDHIIELLIEYDDFENPPFMRIEEFETESQREDRIKKVKLEMEEKYSSVRNYRIL